MAILLKTFDKYSGAEGNKGTLSKAELKTMIEKELPSLLKVLYTALSANATLQKKCIRFKNSLLSHPKGKLFSDLLIYHEVNSS